MAISGYMLVLGKHIHTHSSKKKVILNQRCFTSWAKVINEKNIFIFFMIAEKIQV